MELAQKGGGFMSDLIQIEKGWERWRMKSGGGEFLLKKSDGGRWCIVKFSDGHTVRHVYEVVQRLAEPVKP